MCLCGGVFVGFGAEEEGGGERVCALGFMLWELGGMVWVVES